MRHSSTSTYIPNFIEIEETLCGRTDVRTGGWTFETDCIRSTRRSRPKKSNIFSLTVCPKSGREAAAASNRSNRRLKTEPLLQKHDKIQSVSPSGELQ